MTPEEQAREALTLIRAAGCANSRVVAGIVAWGLGETPEPVLARPQRQPAGPNLFGQFLHDHTGEHP